MSLFTSLWRRSARKDRLVKLRRRTLRMEELEDRSVPSLLGNQLFPADNPWNQRVSNAPVAANSAAIINNIVSRYSDGRLHPDFSQDYDTSSDLYGIPYNVVHGNSTSRVGVIIDGYPGESDLVPAPIPGTVVIEGDLQNGPRFGVDNRGDSHLLIYDVDNNVAYEFYRASRPNENGDGRWHADQESVWDMKTNTFRTIGWTSADAAGLSILAGLVRPDEGLPTNQGGQGVINHAIRFTLQNSIILDQFIYPASHIANSGTNAAVQPPMGARFRLKAGVDLSQLNPQSRIIAQAMKDYGMIVADNGSNFFFSGASRSVDASNQQTLTWNDDDIQDTLHGLKSLHFSDFEVVDLTPLVSDLSVHRGPVGTVVTVLGHNFSGAAGHLQVLFGNTPASSITILDDGRVNAVAPAGSGTVDVRVQSGVTTGDDPDNYKSPIFGYGISAITSAARFTYGGTGNAGPTVVTGADAGGNPEVRVFDAATGALRFGFFAYSADFRGGARVATGDVTGDGTPDIITSPGAGGGPHIKVFDGSTGSLIRELFAYTPAFTGGVFVAAGDVNGDHYADIITGAGAGGGPHVRVFSGRDGSLLREFFAYGATFTGGVSVAAGDVNGDGLADIVTGAGAGGGPHVKVFDGSNTSIIIYSFMAYDPGFIGGVFVAAGDVNGDGRADIVTGAGAGGGPHVIVRSGANLAVLQSFYAFGTSFTGGVRVGIVRDVTGDGLADLILAAGYGGGPHVKVRSGISATIVSNFYAYDPSFTGGVFASGF